MAFLIASGGSQNDHLSFLIYKKKVGVRIDNDNLTPNLSLELLDGPHQNV
jgi:hypothetical protein